MEMSTIEVLNNGMQCLVENMGIVAAEQFVSTVIRERFDYTKWQRDHFDAMSSDEIDNAAVEFAKEHPYKGQGTVITV